MSVQKMAVSKLLDFDQFFNPLIFIVGSIFFITFDQE